MANWAVITIENAPESLIELFAGMAEASRTEGQIPPFMGNPDGYCFDITTEGDVIRFESKWCMPTEVLRQISERLGIEFEATVIESGMLIYGKVKFAKGEKEEYYLPEEYFPVYDIEREEYTYCGEVIDSEEEHLENMLANYIKEKV